MNYTQRLVNTAKRRVLNHALTDTCTITRPGSSLSTDEIGQVVMGEPTLLTYEYETVVDGEITTAETTVIPCRIDSHRAFYPERLPMQEVVADSFLLVLPKPVEVMPDDVIRFNGDDSRTYQARKFNDAASNLATHDYWVFELRWAHGDNT